LVVSTSKDPTDLMLEQVLEVSRRIGAEYIPRRTQKLHHLCARAASGIAYVIKKADTRDGTALPLHELCDAEGSRLFTNPRMWPLVRDKRNEPLLRAIAPLDRPLPTRVVDATAGLGGTAVRIAHSCGERCKVIAVEISAPIACQLDYGMRRLASQGAEWSEAAARIEVVHADAATFLRTQSIQDVDERAGVVYLNPCMDLRSSREDAFLHKIASLKPIAEEAFSIAMDHATSRVVLRHPKGVDLPFGLTEACFTRIPGGQSDFLVVEK